MAANWGSHSNLQSFLDSTTPSVKSRSLPKLCFHDLNTVWHPADGKDTVDYFTLGDLWDHYYEWSAYGAGAPIRLPNGEGVVQYYVPFLSGIQIYTAKSIAAPRNGLEDTESEYSSDDSESEKLSRSWDAASEDSGFDHEGSWPAKERLGHLYFQFFESCSPYGRIPLVDKVYELARSYPGLTSFTSVELSPASWMSVAWYPIYHIPTQRHVKELTACFLTYHTISSSFQDPHQLKYSEEPSAENIPGGVQKDVSYAVAVRNGRKFKERSNCISLTPFGLATYKMQGSLWTNPETGDQEKITSLLNAADSWLKQLRVQHHDFNFFSTHSM